MVVITELRLLELTEGHVGRPVDLTVDVHVVHRGVLFNRQEDHAVQLDLVGVPVGRVGLEDDALLRRPFGERVGPVADEVLRQGPLAAVLFDRVERHNLEGVVRQRVEGIGKRTNGLELEGAVVEGAYRHRFRTGLAGVVVRGTLDEHAREPRVGRGGLGVQDAEPAVHKLLRRDRRPVAPLGVLTQGEGVHRTVVADFPAFGNTGNRGRGLGVRHNETFVQAHHDAVLGNTGHQVRIKRFGLGTVSDNELRDISGSGTTCLLSTAGEAK